MWIDTVYEIAKSTLTGWEVEKKFSWGKCYISGNN